MLSSNVGLGLKLSSRTRLGRRDKAGGSSRSEEEEDL